MKSTFISIIAMFLSFMAVGQSISSIVPTNAIKGESIILSIVGNGTTFKTGTNTVKLLNSVNNNNKINATSVSVISDTLLKAAFSFGSNNITGMYDLVVENQQTGTSVKFLNSFNLKYTGPAILSSTPAEAKQTDTVELTIKAENTHFIQAKNGQVMLENPLNWPDNIQAISITVVDDLTIKGKFAFKYFNPAIVYDVVIYNSIDQKIVLSKAFKLNKGPFPPQIVSVSPNSVNKIDSVLVTIKGKNTFFKRDSNLIQLAGNNTLLSPKAMNYINDTVMTAFFSFTNWEAMGLYDVVVTNSFDKTDLRLINGFTILKSMNRPVLISFTPNNAEQGDSVLMTIKGKNTHFLSGINRVGIIQNYTSLVSAEGKAINDSILEVKLMFEYYVPANKYPIIVSNSIDSVLTTPTEFELKPGKNPPQLVSLFPNNAIQGQKISVRINGTKGCFLRFYAQYAQLSNANYSYLVQITQFINDSTLQASFDIGVNDLGVGTYDFEIKDWYQNKKFTLAAAFTVNKNPNPPALISITPAVVNQFETITMIVKAKNTHFLNGQTVNLQLVSADDPTINIYNIYDSTKIINDSTLQTKFAFSSNYYPSTLYDFVMHCSIDGKLEIKKAFTLNKIYDVEPKIKDYEPREATKGQPVTLTIKGTKHSFRPGNNIVKLFQFTFPVNISIFATSVNYINDSTLTATFSFDSTHQAGYYYLNVYNQASINYLDNKNFNLKEFADINCKLLAVDPPFAAQTDTATLIITGSKTHFNSSSDKIWLQNKFGTKITPFLIHATSDTTTTAAFAFNKSNLPGVYSLYLKSAVDKAILLLKEVFTLSGSINSTSLVDVNPKIVGCYVQGASTLTFKATNTHFITEADTVLIVNTKSFDPRPIYPSEMKILDDTTIVAKFLIDNNCGDFDILVLGKENYILSGKLRAEPPVSVAESPKAEPINIFPNPSEGIFTLDINEDFKEANLMVYDMYGKQIVAVDKLEQSTQIDLSDYAAGIYFVKLIKGNTCKTEKLIKQ